MFNTLVFRGGLQPDYILQLPWWMVKVLFEGIYKTDESSWEQTRFLGSLVLAPYSKKKLSPRDIIKFPWDKDNQSNNWFDNKTLSAEQGVKMLQSIEKMHWTPKNMLGPNYGKSNDQSESGT